MFLPEPPFHFVVPLRLTTYEPFQLEVEVSMSQTSFSRKRCTYSNARREAIWRERMFGPC